MGHGRQRTPRAFPDRPVPRPHLSPTIITGTAGHTLSYIREATSPPRHDPVQTHRHAPALQAFQARGPQGVRRGARGWGFGIKSLT